MSLQRALPLVLKSEIIWLHGEEPVDRTRAGMHLCFITALMEVLWKSGARCQRESLSNEGVGECAQGGMSLGENINFRNLACAMMAAFTAGILSGVATEGRA